MATSIPRHADFHAAPRSSPFAAKFTAYGGKREIAHFLLHLYLLQGFFGLFLKFYHL